MSILQAVLVYQTDQILFQPRPARLHPYPSYPSSVSEDLQQLRVVRRDRRDLKPVQGQEELEMHRVLGELESARGRP